MNRFSFLVPVAAFVAAVAPLTAAELEVAALKFVAPKGWRLAETARPMSAGGFVQEEAPKLEATVFHFPNGQGGSVEANIQRWTAQYAAEPAPTVEKEALKAGDKEITLVTITGTYKGSSMRPEPVPLKDHVTLAAIIPGPEGNVFVRLNGSKDDAAKAKADFKALTSSPFAK
jgi:hypothetical protein